MKKFLKLVLVIWVLLVNIPAYTCTIFYVSKNDKILVGSNKDWITTDAYILFYPAEKGKYGRVLFGLDFGLGNKEPIGGINEQGLFFEMATVANVELENDINTVETYQGNIYEKILQECSTVEETVALVRKYNNLLYETFTQILIGDRNANSVILDRHYMTEKNNSYQIMTNFRQTTDHFLNNKITCERYMIVESMLRNENEISNNFFKRILANTHKESQSTTVYSIIYDLKDLKLYLYFFHNFLEEIVLDVKNELRKGHRIIKMDTLFPQQYAAKSFMEWKNWEMENRKKSRLNEEISIELLPNIQGKYVQNEGSQKNQISIEFRNNKIFFVSSNNREHELLPETSHKFFIPTVAGDLGITFLKDKTEEISGLIVKYELFGIKEYYLKIK